MKQNEICSLTVADLSQKLRSRELSAVEAAEAYGKRIEAVDREYNAYITPTPALALEEAREADKMLESGEGGALCGVPYSVKDNIAVRGVKLTCASNMLRDFVAPYDATVRLKIKEAGGVLLGKTNLDEFAMGSSTEKSVFGATKNPLDITRSAGGSSGGAAASVVSLTSPWAIGTDTGGSARQPAAFCGAVSMKPTYGLVSRYGVVEFASSLDTVCPITRNVYDSAFVLSAMAGRDELDMTSVESEGDFLSGIDSGVGGVRVGVLSFDGEREGGANKASYRAAQLLESVGASVGEAFIGDASLALEAYMIISASEASSNLARYDGIKYGMSCGGDSYSEIVKNTREAGFGDEVKRRISAGAYALLSELDGNYYSAVKAERELFSARLYRMLDEFDVLVMPTAADVAFPLGEYSADPTEMYMSDVYTNLANLAGVPAITLPSGGDGRLPYGVTLMGKRLSEKLLYRAAYALEDMLRDTVKKEALRYEI